MTFTKRIFLTATIFCSAFSYSKGQTQIGTNINGQGVNDNSGNAVSMPDAKTVAIGAYKNNGNNGTDAGHVRVFELKNGSWVLKGNDIEGAFSGDRAGASVSMPNPGTVAIGSDFHNPNGHVRVFDWNGAIWVKRGIDLEGDSVVGERAGSSVSMPDDNTVAFGDWGSDTVGYTNRGYVKVFEWTINGWTQKGNKISGENAQDNFGFDISMPTSNVIAVGARYNDGGGTHSGHVRILDWNGSSWVQRGSDIDGEAAGDRAGNSVSMPDSFTVAVASPRHGSDSGHVRIYKWNGSNWVQKGGEINGSTSGVRFGSSVSMSDSNSVAIGAINAGNGVTQTGSVQVYEWNGSAWIQLGNTIYGDSYNDQMGTSVSMGAPKVVACGARLYDVVASNSNEGVVKMYNFCSSSAFDTTVNRNHITLTSNQNNVNYQWLDCNQGNSPIAGETGQSFTATINGSYAVELTDSNGCSDTSNCISITSVGLNSLKLSNVISVYPNPFSESLNIKVESGEKLICTIRNLTAASVAEYSLHKSLTNIDLSECPSGIYIVEVIAETKEIYRKKIVKQ